MDNMTGQSEPEVSLVGSGSDHGNFIFIRGVPVVDLGYDVDSNKYPGLFHKSYPAYHTGFVSYQSWLYCCYHHHHYYYHRFSAFCSIETFRLVSELNDPGFLFHKTCADMNVYLARDFSDRLLLDFRPTAYATLMTDSLADLAEAIDLLEEEGIETRYWIEQIGAFAVAAKQWERR